MLSADSFPSKTTLKTLPEGVRPSAASSASAFRRPSAGGLGAGLLGDGHEGVGLVVRRDDVDGAARGFDLLARALREAVRRDGERLRALAGPEHDDVALALGDDAALVHRLGRDGVARREAVLKRGERDLDPLLLEDVGEAALGEPPLQGHLAALEADLARVARARLLTLVAAPGRLAEPGARAPPDALLLVRRARGRLQIVQTDSHCSLRSQCSVFSFQFSDGALFLLNTEN